MRIRPRSRTALPLALIWLAACGDETASGGTKACDACASPLADAAPEPGRDARRPALESDRGGVTLDAAIADAGVMDIDARSTTDALLAADMEWDYAEKGDALPQDAVAVSTDLAPPPTPDAAPPAPDAAPLADLRRPEPLPDAATPDAATPDAATPDVAIPDAAIPDAAIQDAAVPDAAPPECLPGETRVAACGLNGRGRQTQDCVNGAFGPLSPCADPDVCRDATVEQRACPGGGAQQRRVCVDGQWGAFSACPAHCVVDELEPNDTWQVAVSAPRRLPVNIDQRTGLTLLPGDTDFIDFETHLINLDLTATISADPACGAVGQGGRVCVEMSWYTWVQDEGLIDPEPILLQGPVCGDLSTPLFLDAGGVAGLAGEPWTSIVLHVYHAPGSADVPVSYRIDVTRGPLP